MFKNKSEFADDLIRFGLRHDRLSDLIDCSDAGCVDEACKYYSTLVLQYHRKEFTVEYLASILAGIDHEDIDQNVDALLAFAIFAHAPHVAEEYFIDSFLSILYEEVKYKKPINYWKEFIKTIANAAGEQFS